MNFTRLEPELAELRARRLDARGPRLPHPRLLAEPPVLRLVERFDIEPFPDFSANFASNYSLESSWRDLQDLRAFAPLRPQYFRNCSSNLFSHFSAKLCKVSLSWNSFHRFLLRFDASSALWSCCSSCSCSCTSARLASCLLLHSFADSASVFPSSFKRIFKVRDELLISKHFQMFR